MAAARDQGDNLSRTLEECAEAKTTGPTIREGMGAFAEDIASIQDAEQVRINRLQTKVVTAFSKYGFYCYFMKDQLLKGQQIRKREQLQAQEYLRLQHEQATPHGTCIKLVENSTDNICCTEK